jgi:glycosyltransferase involved in cell wall biosynthesis
VQKLEKKKINFSVAIITFNEEKNIKDCIESIIEIADEIIILDSNSTDNTKKISTKYKKVKFYNQDFKGHIEQKNDAIKLCSGEWILSLDADERASSELILEIQNIILENPKVDGYKIKRLTYHIGKFIKHSGWYPQYKYRFFKKGKAFWSGENPHDYIVLNGTGKKIHADIIHYSFKDLSHQVDTINKFSSIVAFTRFHKNKKFSVLVMLFKPFIKFLEIYIFKLGFLDGFQGFVIAISSSYSTFLKETKLYELEKKQIERPSNLRIDYGGKK